MSEEKNFFREEKDRERYRATFVPHACKRRRAVRPPTEKTGDARKGKEVPQDEKGHEYLRIDMGWSGTASFRRARGRTREEEDKRNRRDRRRQKAEEIPQATTRNDAGAG